MIIDAHQHLWQIGQHDHTWPTPDLASIYRDFVTSDLLEAANLTGVDGTVLVQSQPADADTDWLLQVAKATPLIKAVVGWADMAAPQAAERVRALARRPKFRGLRPMLQGLDDDAWILQPSLDPAFKVMVDLGLTFDALIYSRHLPAIATLARRWPELSIILDHGAKPPLAGKDLNAWRDAMASTAEADNITCKLSGLVTEMAEGQDMAITAACADHLLDIFGPERLMWGSDWPVVLLRGSYGDWFGWTRRWLRDKDITVREHVMGRTAERVYKLSQG